MPGMIRPNKQAMKIVYNILKTPKDERQKRKKTSEKRVREWFIDSSMSQ